LKSAARLQSLNYSGGPTLELVNGKYVVTGVHSSSLSFNSTDGGTPRTLLESDVIFYAKDNDFLWKDVNATAYGTWITGAEASVNTNLPEPTCLGSRFPRRPDASTHQAR
jgi:hypothetical protein